MQPAQRPQTYAHSCTFMFIVARIWSIARLTKRAALLIQFISCTAFDELHNIWSVVQCILNTVRAMVRVRLSFRVRVSVSDFSAILRATVLN